MLEPAFGHPIARIRRQRLVGTIGQHDPRDAEEGGAADDRTEIVRVADAIEDQQRLAILRPRPGLLPGRDRATAAGGRRRRRRHAVRYPAITREFGADRLHGRVLGAGERSGRAESNSSSERGLEEQPLDPAGIALEQARTAASPQIRSSSRSCGGRAGCAVALLRGRGRRARHRARRHRGRGAVRDIRAHIHHVAALIDAQTDRLPQRGGDLAAGRRASARRDRASPDHSGRWRSAPWCRGARAGPSSSDDIARPRPPSWRSPCQFHCCDTSLRRARGRAGRCGSPSASAT